MRAQVAKIVALMLVSPVLACSPSGALPGDAKAVAAAVAGLAAADAVERAAAACSLRDLGLTEAGVLAALEPLLADDRRVEGLSCGGHGWIDGAECLRITSPAREAARALAELMPASLPVLLRSLGVPSAVTRAYAAYALGESGDPRGGAPLLALLGDSSPRVRGNAAEALGKLEAESAAESLLLLLDDLEPEVRRAVVEALAALG